jgi:hypothetical protein
MGNWIKEEENVEVISIHYQLATSHIKTFLVFFTLSLLIFLRTHKHTHICRYISIYLYIFSLNVLSLILEDLKEGYEDNCF